MCSLNDPAGVQMSDLLDKHEDLNRVPSPGQGKGGGDNGETGEGYSILTPAVSDKIIKSLARGRPKKAKKRMLGLHPSDLADFLQNISPGLRRDALDVLGEDMAPEVVSELDETVRDEVIEHIGTEQLAAVVAELETDDALEIIKDMDEGGQRKVLDAIPVEDRTVIEESLAYPEDSAGRLMQRELVAVPEFWTVGECIDYMRRTADEADDEFPDHFYDIFVVDPTHTPVGAVALSKILKSKRLVQIKDVMETDLRVVNVDMDQEEVAFLFRQRDLVSAPVVDGFGRLVGAITVDDVVDVIHQEHEEDIMRLAGLAEDDLYSAAIDTAKSRFAWLLVNLGTAMLASFVIGMFEATLEHIVALAVLMPIVASMGGNAGTQTLTVAVRALATRELTTTNAFRVMTKEIIVGGFNGALFAVLIGLIAWAWFGSLEIGVIMAVAMVLNLVVAGFAGTAIPLFLERWGADPAVASSVFLTTATDVIGFAAFLGLAAVFLM